MLTLSEVTNLREAILCATLAERPVRIEFKQQVIKPFKHNIKQPEGHLQRFLSLMQSVQTGCRVEVTPKRITYIPGIITNNSGAEFDFDCGNDRAIGYFLEPLIILSLFGKSEIKVNLMGFTNDHIDQSVDSIQNCLIPLVKRFAPDFSPIIKVQRRGFLPNATGKVYFHGQAVKYLKAMDILERGPFKRIRGVCSGSKIAPNLLNRVVSTCRGVFNDYIPNVWVHTDFQKSQKGYEFANGYAVSLVAESVSGCYLSVDAEYISSQDTPESVGEKASLRLLDEIHYSGCVDTSNQQYALLLMALAEKRVSQIRLGRLSVHTIETLRLIRDLIGVTFQIERPKDQVEDQMDEELLDEKKAFQQTMIFTCLGSGVVNISRYVK